MFLLLLVSPAQLDLCQSRPVPQYKNFQIEVGSQGYRLFGTETFRTNLKELLEHLQGQSLRTENLRFQLRRCCPPQPRGIIIMRRNWRDTLQPGALGNSDRCYAWLFISRRGTVWLMKRLLYRE